MKHAKISILAFLAVFILSVPAFAIVEEPTPTPSPSEPAMQEPAPNPAPKPARQQAPAPAKQAPVGNPKPDTGRVKACEKRQEQIQRKTAKYIQNAQKYQSVVDKLYERVQGFYETGQLTVGNYIELETAAGQAKSQSQASIQSLGEMGGAVDCTDPDVATQSLKAFRGLAGQTRTELRSYSTSVKNMISAMQSAHSNANGGDPAVKPDPAEPVETEPGKEVIPTTPDVPPPSDQEGL